MFLTTTLCYLPPKCSQTLFTCGQCIPNEGRIGCGEALGLPLCSQMQIQILQTGERPLTQFGVPHPRDWESCLRTTHHPAVTCWCPYFCVHFEFQESSSCSRTCLVLSPLSATCWGPRTLLPTFHQSLPGPLVICNRRPRMKRAHSSFTFLTCAGNGPSHPFNTHFWSWGALC